jgi:hypothetical protein
MTEIDDLLKIEKDEEKEVLAVKKMMEDILEENMGKPFHEEELCSLCHILGVSNTRVLWKAWKKLVEEHNDGTTYVNICKAFFGKMRPLIYNKEVFENGKSVRKIGFNPVS